MEGLARSTACCERPAAIPGRAPLCLWRLPLRLRCAVLPAPLCPSLTTCLPSHPVLHGIVPACTHWRCRAAGMRDTQAA